VLDKCCKPTPKKFKVLEKRYKSTTKAPQSTAKHRKSALSRKQ
jgi:hypothetical protein